MFHGSIPASMQSVIAEHVRQWQGEHVYVGCSGNFTVERVVQSVRPNVVLHGNDVTIYSCLIGAYLARQAVPLALQDNEWGAEYAWLAPWIEDPADAIATVLLCTRMLQGMANRAPYYERMRAAYRAQWPELHAATKAKVEKATLRLESFFAGDVVEWVNTIPAGAGVICFPPFFAGDYESMFARLEDVFAWTPPSYEEFNDDRRVELIRRLSTHDGEWMIGTHVRQPTLQDHLCGLVQTTNRGVPIFIYTHSGAKRIVQPRQELEPVFAPRLGERESLGETLGLAVLTGGQFFTLRSQYMNAHIKPGMPSVAFGVLVDGKLVGAYALSFAPTLSNWDNHVPMPTAYLLSDFPIAPTKYKRLAKLVLMAALSREAKLLAERYAHHRIRSVTTTAFTDRPVSMKYRGLFELLSRKEGDDGRHRFKLGYGTVYPEFTLAEQLARWKRDHGSAVE